ncbi:DNA ligase, partial [Vibrio diabolicus]
MPLKMTLIALAVMTASSQLQADTSITPPVSLAQSYQD